MIVHPESHLGKCIRRGRGKPYEYDMLDYIREHHNGDGVAIDVGAHIGNHTLYLALACGLRVVAFEPIFYQELSANIRLNDLENRVVIVPCALGARSEYMQDTGERVLSSPLGPVDAGSEGGLEHGDGMMDRDRVVSVHPLDGFAGEIQSKYGRVQLLKADIEGMEVEMLRGAVQILERDHPALYLETKTEEDVEAVGEILTPLGYELKARFKKLTQRTAWA